MKSIVGSIEAEYRRYKALGEGAIAQLQEAELSVPGPGGGNSVAIVVWHVAGNLASRFTDFLASDGEKSWRQRDEEFASRHVSRQELISKWQHGWDTLFSALSDVGDERLDDTVTIRDQPLRVHDALHRSLAHVSYHIGQIVYIAKSFRGDAWRFLSIPPGGSDAYNQQPTLDRPATHATTLNRLASEED